MNDDLSKTAQDVGRSKLLDHEFDHLFGFMGAVGSNLDLDALMENAVSELHKMTCADKILVAVITGNEDKKESVAVSARGLPESSNLEITIGDVAEIGVEARESVNEKDLPTALRNIAPHVNGPWAIIPLTVYGKQVGLMLVSRGDPFSEASVKLMNLAGRQFAIAVENSRLFADLQRSYRRLLNTQEELIRSERLAAVGGLAATMAHEIRNPLATIFSSLSQIRKHGQITGDSATLLKIAEEEAARLNRMVGGLLEFARPKMPRIHDVDPLEVINEVVGVALSNPEFPGGIEITISSDDRITSANLDPELFRRALQHVISNALDAVEPPNGSISIRVKAENGQRQKLTVAVRDNGSGISTELKPSIFEPFFSTKPTGIGLGLCVVKRIVEDHEGSIEIDSEPGTGTEVRLFFNK